MKTTCLLILENNLDNGSIIIDSNPKDIKQDSFEIELEIETDTPKSFLSSLDKKPTVVSVWVKYIKDEFNSALLIL